MTVLASNTVNWYLLNCKVFLLDLALSERWGLVPPLFVRGSQPRPHTGRISTELGAVTTPCTSPGLSDWLFSLQHLTLYIQSIQSQWTPSCLLNAGSMPGSAWVPPCRWSLDTLRRQEEGAFAGLFHSSALLLNCVCCGVSCPVLPDAQCLKADSCISPGF